jgi:hypothetical protein
MVEGGANYSSCCKLRRRRCRGAGDPRVCEADLFKCYGHPAEISRRRSPRRSDSECTVNRTMNGYSYRDTLMLTRGQLGGRSLYSPTRGSNFDP